MELYTPEPGHFYEDRSDGTLTAVNRRKNYENLMRSIEAHKNRLAMARIKKGKNLPFDDTTKTDNMSYCRQSTADTNEYEGPFRFRRHTRSSLSKINTNLPKNNSMTSPNGMEERYGQELYIRSFEDFRPREQSLARYNMNVDNNLITKNTRTFGNNQSTKVEVDSKELENKIIEVLGKLVLSGQFKSGLEGLEKNQETWSTQVTRDENHDKMVDLLTKCISTTLNSTANESCDNLSSSRTSRSVNVEINLNVPQSKETEPLLAVNMENDCEELGNVPIENVFSRDSKEVNENILKTTLKKFKSLYLGSKDSGKTKENATRSVEKNLKGNQNNMNNQVNNADLQEQMLWSRGIQANRRNGPGQFVFRPFSRSRSQSLHARQNANCGNNQSLFRTNSLFQSSKGVPSKGVPFTPVQRGNFGNCQNGTVQNNRQANGFNSQLTENGVDPNFNPFNLPQNLNGQNGRNWGSQPNLGNCRYNGPMVRRNNSSSGQSRTAEGVRQGGNYGCFQTDRTERFEKMGVGCLDAMGIRRQASRPVMVRTANMNQRMSQNPPIFRNKVQSEGAARPPQTPAGVPMAKRMNTEPKNLNRFNVNSPGLVRGNQMTGDLNSRRNWATVGVKLVESNRLINTLNKLSDLNTMYHL